MEKNKNSFGKLLLTKNQKPNEKAIYSPIPHTVYSNGVLSDH